jgi:signal transduction histidine kinase
MSQATAKRIPERTLGVEAPTPAGANRGDLVQVFSGPRGIEGLVEMAHDLRSPLNSILFLADALRRGTTGPITEDQRHQLGVIYAAALYLNEAASDVVELARGGGRLADERASHFTVSEVFAAVEGMVRPIAEERRLDLRLENGIEETRLGHPRALGRVLLNLSTNALKFTKEGFVEISARLTERDRAAFSVRDTGPGISRVSRETLYDPFRREDHRYVFSGSGLGLAICRRLVTAMGGELHLDTDPKTGTKFSFELTLPLAEPE